MIVKEGFYGWIKPLSWVKPVYMQKKDLYKVPKGFYSSKRKVHYLYNWRAKRNVKVLGSGLVFKSNPFRRFTGRTPSSPFFYKHFTQRVSTRTPIASQLYVDLSSWFSAKRIEKKFNLPIKSMILVRRYSKSPCIFGKTYGFRGNIAWVHRGCRGRFLISFYGLRPKVQKSVRKVVKKPTISRRSTYSAKINQIQRLLNISLQKKKIIEMDVKRRQGLTKSLKRKIDDFCNVIGNIAELEGKNKIKAISECKSKWYSLANSYKVQVSPVSSKLKSTKIKQKVRTRLPPVVRWSSPSFQSWISPGITFKRESPEIGGTSIVELQKGAEIQEEGKIKRILEKKYFGVPFKYIAIGSLGLVALLSILGGSSQQPKIIIAGGRYV